MMKVGIIGLAQLSSRAVMWLLQRFTVRASEVSLTFDTDKLWLSNQTTWDQTHGNKWHRPAAPGTVVTTSGKIVTGAFVNSMWVFSQTDEKQRQYFRLHTWSNLAYYTIVSFSRQRTEAGETAGTPTEPALPKALGLLNTKDNLIRNIFFIFLRKNLHDWFCYA